MRAWGLWLIGLMSCSGEPVSVSSEVSQGEQALAALPSGGCVPPGMPAIEAADFGVLPGLTDVSSALNEAITAAAATGHFVHIAAGRYDLARPIRMVTNARVIGDGPRTVLSASVAPSSWAPGEALVHFKNVQNAALCSLTLDHQGTRRSTTLDGLDHTMVLSNAQSNLISAVTFRNAGTTVGAPSGPALLLITRQPCTAKFCNRGTVCGGKGQPPFDPMYSGTTDPAVPGNVESNLIQGCAFELDERLQTGFAVRLWTDFTCKRDPAEFTYRVQGNVIEKSTFASTRPDGGAGGDGGFFWNTVELAGGGTSNNIIRGNIFEGRTLSHVDFDKGASFNRAEKNVVNFVTVPDRRLTDIDGGGVVFHLPSSGLTDHGSDTSYVNRNNVLTGNTVWSIGRDALTDSNAGGIVVQHTVGSYVEKNLVGAVFGGDPIGGALVLVGNVRDATIHDNTLGRVTTSPARWPVGVGIRANGSGLRHLSITQNVIAANDTAVVIGQVPDGCGLIQGATELSFTHNTVRNQQAISGSGAVTIAAEAPYVANNTIVGGDWGLYLRSPGAFVEHNVITGSLHGIALSAGAALAANSAPSCGLSCGASATYPAPNSLPLLGQTCGQ